MTNKVILGTSIDAGYFDFSDEPGFAFANFDSFPMDFDGDGVDEILFAGFETQYNTPANYTNTNLAIFGWKDNRFQDLTSSWLPGDTRHVEAVGDIAYGDFNGDGLIDFYTAANADMNYLIESYAFINQGGYFSKYAVGINEWEHGVASADLNGDGYDDVIPTTIGGDNRFIYLGSPSGLIQHSVTRDNAANFGFDIGATGGSGIAIGDFFGTGRMSVVTTDSSSNNRADTELKTVVLDSSNHVIGLKYYSTLPLPLIEDSQYRNPSLPDGYASHDVRARTFDFIGSELPDLVIFSNGSFAGVISSQIQFLENLGGGRFRDVTSNFRHGYTADVPISYAPILLNVNRDGYQDIFISAGGTAALLLGGPEGFTEFFRTELSEWIGGDGGSSSLIMGPDFQYHVLSLRQEYGGETSVSAISLDILTGSLLLASESDGQLIGTSGNDVFRGTSGIDHVVFSGDFTDYQANRNFGLWQFADGILNRDGADTLTNIERLSFTDGTLALDIAPGQNAGEVYRLYQAAFARTPDMPGVKYHLNDMEANGLPLWQIASNFLASPEFATQYGQNPTDTQYINALYHNVLNRTPGQSEVDWYQNQFNTKAMDHQAALIGFSESPENVALVGSAIVNGIWLG
jgi:hypothetical protein